MAIIDVKEELKRTANQDERSIGGDRIFTVLFDETDTPQSRPFLANFATGIPALFEIHPYNSWLYVKNKHVETKGPFLYEVTIHYESFSDPWSSAPVPINPLLQPPDVSYDFVTRQEQIDRDINGDPIVNSSNESFATPITKEFYDLVVRVGRNEKEFNALLAAEYKGALNSDIFLGFPVELVKCITIKGDKQHAASLIYYRVNYEFHVRWIGWKRKIVDEGYRIKTGVSGGKATYDTIKDDEGIPLSQPVQLDGSGNQLDDGADLVILEFEVDEKLPFSVFNL